MFIAKFTDGKGQVVFAEVVRVGSVRFDPRPGWILLAHPLSVKAHKRNRVWVAPDFRFEWVRRIKDAPLDHG